MLRRKLGKAIDRGWKVIIQKKGIVFAILALIAAALIFGLSLDSLGAVIIIGGLFIVASLSTFYKRYFRAPPVFELMTFGTVLVTAKYGFTAGFIFGALSQMAAEILSGAVDAQILIFVPARANLATFTWVAMNLFNITSFFTLGIIAIVAYNLMVQPISWILGDMQLRAKTIYYTIFFTLFNFFIFSVLKGLGEFLIRV